MLWLHGSGRSVPTTSSVFADLQQLFVCSLEVLHGGLYFHDIISMYVSDLILSSHLVIKLQNDWSSQKVLTVVSLFFLWRRSKLGDLGHIIKFRKTVNSETWKRPTLPMFVLKRWVTTYWLIFGIISHYNINIPWVQMLPKPDAIRHVPCSLSWYAGSSRLNSYLFTWRI